MGVAIPIIVYIIYQFTFLLSVDIFCNSYKVLVKSFSNSLLISDFFILKF